MGLVDKIGGVDFPGGPGTGHPPSSPAEAPYDSTIDFNRDAFDAAIADKGYDLVWEKAAFCPNRPPDGPAPGAHDINCKLCDGSGWVYFDSKECRGLVTGVTLRQGYYINGRWDAGSIMVTAQPEHQIHYFDRLTLGNSTARFQELVWRQKGSNLDVLKYTPLAVLYVVSRSRAGVLHTHVVGTDVRISGGSLEWLTTTRPDAGDFYSVAYTYRPRYVVMDLLHQHRDSTVDGTHYAFPVQAVAKLDFLVRDESKDAPEIVDTNPFPSGK